jgi:hypothetical protein
LWLSLKSHQSCQLQQTAEEILQLIVHKTTRSLLIEMSSDSKAEELQYQSRDANDAKYSLASPSLKETHVPMSIMIRSSSEDGTVYCMGVIWELNVYTGTYTHDPSIGNFHITMKMKTGKVNLKEEYVLEASAQNFQPCNEHWTSDGEAMTLYQDQSTKTFQVNMKMKTGKVTLKDEYVLQAAVQRVSFLAMRTGPLLKIQ